MQFEIIHNGIQYTQMQFLQRFVRIWWVSILSITL